MDGESDGGNSEGRSVHLDSDRDPLGVLESTSLVVEQARWVAIDRKSVRDAAATLAQRSAPLPAWPADLHPAGRNESETANLTLVLDALNFCFWSIPGSDKPRWRVHYNGQTYDGYWALAVALRRAVERGVPLADAGYLSRIDEADVAGILSGESGGEAIPLLRARFEHLREVGQVLERRWNGTFLTPIRHAAGSAPDLVRQVIDALPSFDDTAIYRGRQVRFYKRAQILVADLFGAFGGRGPGFFHDMETLTAFADYKVPQVLRRFGVLEYDPRLAGGIQRYELLDPGSDPEVEIRAATVWGVELIRQELAARGRDVPAYEIDWLLWDAGQSLPARTEPYHRTLTVYY